MANYTMLNVGQDLEAVLHGTSLTKVVNLDGLYNRTARQLLADCNPAETVRIVPLTTPIYNQIYDYSCPIDLKDSQVIDIRPQVNRVSSDDEMGYTEKNFDIQKDSSGLNQTTSLQNIFNIQWNSGIKTLRLSEQKPNPGIILNKCDALDDSGLWSTGGTASNIGVDSQNFAAGFASIKFDLGAGSPGYLENSTIQAIDLSQHLNQSTIFLYTYLPVGTDFTDIKLRWGSDASNYYEVTATTTQQNTVFQNGWNLLAFNWLGATVVGTPDSTNITYLRVTWDYNGTAQTAVKLDNIISDMGLIYEMVYYSKYLFRDANTGAFQEVYTDDSNLINLDTESYNLYFNLLAYYACQQVQGINEMFFDYQFFMDEYLNSLERYNSINKSKTIPTQSQYFPFLKMRF